MTPTGLWSRIALGSTLAVVLPLTLDIPPPTQLRASPALGLAIGLVAGTILYAIVARRRPVAVGPAGPLPTAFIVGWATVEEIVWRWLLLGGLALAVPAAAAFVATIVAFAWAHAHGRRGHLLTGATFGGVYLLTGTLLAPVLAHVVYNLLVAGSLRTTRAQAQPG